MFSTFKMRIAGTPIDPAIAAFSVASGATDLLSLSNLASYLRAQSLLSASRCYPMKSAQNAGSGSTVFGWGDLTANNMTLINSPTWGASGVSLNGTTQLARISDFTSAETITVFCRANKTDDLTNISTFFAQHDTGANQRSVTFQQRGDVAGDPLRVIRSSDGGSFNLELYDTTKTGLDAETCFSAQWVNGGGRSLWANKTPLSLTFSAGFVLTSRFDSSADWTLGAFLNNNVPTAFAQMTATAMLFVQGSLTTQQRETITDLINAL